MGVHQRVAQLPFCLRQCVKRAEPAALGLNRPRAGPGAHDAQGQVQLRRRLFHAQRHLVAGGRHQVDLRVRRELRQHHLFRGRGRIERLLGAQQPVAGMQSHGLLRRRVAQRVDGERGNPGDIEDIENVARRKAHAGLRKVGSHGRGRTGGGNETGTHLAGSLRLHGAGVGADGEVGGDDGNALGLGVGHTRNDARGVVRPAGGAGGVMASRMPARVALSQVLLGSLASQAKTRPGRIGQREASGKEA